MNLQLERRNQEDRTAYIGPVVLTPSIDEDYWRYRVRLSDSQAIVGFPKFSTIGIGFAVEEDWNTNLPWTCEAQEILEHIRHNKGNDTITDREVLEAIVMVQEAVAEDTGEKKKVPVR